MFKSVQLQYMWTNYTKAIHLQDENVDKLNEHQLKSGQGKYNSNDIQGLKTILYKLEYLFTGDLFQVNYKKWLCFAGCHYKFSQF